MSESDSNLSMGLTRIVLDALKPREVSIVELALAIIEVNGVENVDINVTEVDARTETLKINIAGWDVDMDDIEEVLEKYSTIIRSIDAVSAAKKI